MDVEMQGRSVVAMSGGVDSSVAALILKRQGHSLLGVSMQVWDYRNNGGSRSRATCCAPDDFLDARRVAGLLEIPYYVFDFENTFRTEVIDKFVASYQAGLTPNPCVDCNNKVKFRALRERALTLGGSKVATGHYAQIEERADGFHLLRGRDPEKDQSYFLYGLKPAELADTLFPIGHLEKKEVRELAREAGLVTADKPESQDICFVSGKVQDFIVSIGGKKSSGSMELRDGTKVGEHSGIQNFTVGQRRGLGVGGSEAPLYVVELRPETNTVVVGAKQELEREGFLLEECNWVSPLVRTQIEAGQFPIKISVLAQVRHRHPGVPVEIQILDAEHASVRFQSGWATVSPGQAGVLYDLDNRELLGGGRITSF